MVYIFIGGVISIGIGMPLHIFYNPSYSYCHIREFIDAYRRGGIVNSTLLWKPFRFSGYFSFLSRISTLMLFSIKYFHIAMSCVLLNVIMKFGRECFYILCSGMFTFLTGKNRKGKCWNNSFSSSFPHLYEIVPLENIHSLFSLLFLYFNFIEV